MSYIGNRPDTNILYYALGIDRFNGTGSQTVFALSRELGQDLDAQVIVENVNRAPLLEDLDDVVVSENETVIISPVAFDPDQDQISYSITEPFTDFTWTPGFDAAGTYQVTVTVSDGDLDASQTFTLTVEDVNRPPTNFTFSVY